MSKLSENSLQILSTVNPLLSDIVKKVVEVTDLHLEVIAGKRTKAEHLEMFYKGLTHKSYSTHIFGYAVDLMVYVDDKPTWQTAIYCDLAESMRLVAEDMEVGIRWGGAYHYGDITSYEGSTYDLYLDYIRELSCSSATPYIDLPHFELSTE